MDENDTEKSAKLVIDHVANKSIQYSVPVGASTAKVLNNWGSVTRKRNTVFGQILSTIKIKKLYD